MVDSQVSTIPLAGALAILYRQKDDVALTIRKLPLSAKSPTHQNRTQNADN